VSAFVTGALGQLGQDLLPLIGNDAVLTDQKENTDLNVRALDVTNADAVMAAITVAKPTVVYHCAAYTNVDAAEDAPEIAKAVNEAGTANVAKAAQAVGATLVAISTDYVFDGTSGQAYTETDMPNPQSVYGKTKLASEQVAQANCQRTHVVRSAWLYGPKKLLFPVKNFPQTMKKLAAERPELTIVNDQIGSPTFTADLAAALVTLSRSDDFGIWHITNAGQASWYDFACEILRDEIAAGLVVSPIPSSAYPQKAKRPAHSVLDTTKFSTAFGPMRTWQEALADYSVCQK